VNVMFPSGMGGAVVRCSAVLRCDGMAGSGSLMSEMRRGGGWGLGGVTR
jgi:hypothetical protein